MPELNEEFMERRHSRHEEEEIEDSTREAIRLLKEIADGVSFLVGNTGVQSLQFFQLGEDMVSQFLIGLTPGQTSVFQIVPVDSSGNAIALDAGSTVTYTSSDPACVVSALPSDPSGLTMQAVSATSLTAKSVVLQATASLQKNGKTPTTGPVTVSVLTAVAGGAVSLVFNQLS
jgi:hypothetical protein